MERNPFNDENGRFYVLVNDRNEYSMWPAFADVPHEWRAAFGPAIRRDCLTYIEENWTDPRLAYPDPGPHQDGDR